MKQPKNIIIIGATSSIAEHCARIWLKNGVANLILIGRNVQKMAHIAQDLRVRSPQSHVEVMEANFTEPQLIQELVNKICADKIIDVVLIAHGSLADQNECQKNLEQIEASVTINGVSPILFAEAFIAHMEKANYGTLALISSVAGERGRKSNYVYGAAKALVTQYAQGLQHRLAKTKVNVVLIKPGPTDTPMTAHLKQQNIPLADVKEVAQHIVSGVERGKTVIYTPHKWALIMFVIRNLPRFIFNKMDI